MSADPWLVVGLGNPGPDYAGHRHNVGAMVLTQLASDAGVTFTRHKSHALIATTRVGSGQGSMILARPSTFMNVSGKPVAALARFFDVAPERTVVIHDELDIPFEDMRIKFGGGHGGHNGLRDIINALGTQDFVRVRVGIGRPPGRQDAAAFVLRDFTRTERAVLPDILTRAADTTRLIAEVGYRDAQQKVHAPPPT